MNTATATAAASGNGNGNGNGHGSSHNRIKGVPGKSVKASSGRRASGKGSGNGSSNGHGGNPSHALLSAAEIELRLQAWEKFKTEAKAAYEQADAIEAELIRSIGVGGCLTLSDNRTARVVNNFVDASGNPKAKHFGLAGVKMYELKLK